jgi:hypothetical protein
VLALKLTGTRRVSHVNDLAADPGAALFAGLTALPKTTALTSYSYRLDHTRQTALLTELGKQMIQANLITDTGGDLDLDFHAIMHWGQDIALEKHYVPSRSQRTRSVLSFFAQDGASQTLVYANADLSKATQAGEVLVFADHWKTLTGNYPRPLVMDQKVTNQNVLAQLHDRGITFITLRRRSTSLTRHIAALPATAWRTVRLDRDGAYKTPKVVDEITTLSAYPHPVRQLIITGLGRDTPTVIITNDTHASAKQIIERYAQRMNIEQRLAESIRSFHVDALRRVRPPQRRPRRRAHRAGRRRLRRPPPTSDRLPARHPRHPATTVPVHTRHHHHHHGRHHRPPRPPHLLTRPPRGRPSRNHRPLARQPHRALRIRLTTSTLEQGSKSLPVGSGAGAVAMIWW